MPLGGHTLSGGHAPHLAACVNTLQHASSSARIPEAYAAVSSAATTGQQAMCMWAPGDCLDSSNVLCETQRRCCTTVCWPPHQQGIVITTGCQLTVIR